MKTQVAIAQRVKFLIKHIVGRGIAKNQEDLGRMLGIDNKSYLSQLVNCARPNGKFIESLVNLVPDFNKEWLYDEEIEAPFKTSSKSVLLDAGSGSLDFSTAAIATQAEILQKLQRDIEMLKKDVKYYAEIAEMRLQTIDLQSKLIAEMEKNR